MLLNRFAVRLSPAQTTGAALTLAWLIIYLTTVSPTVNFIDSGELITAAYEPGIAHPPGYPLYVLMGYVVTHLLGGEIAWRLNVLSSFWSALTIGSVYALMLTVTSYVEGHSATTSKAKVEPSRTARAKSKTAPTVRNTPAPFARRDYSVWEMATAAAAASLLGVSATFWSRSAQAKMYSLHYFFVALLFWLALKYRWARESQDHQAARRWLAVLAVAGSVSFTNHLMTNLLVPGLLLLVLWGSDWRERAHALLQEWKIIVVSMLPLLLYLYLPIRMAQGPFMNWGSPDNWGDFWRHVGVWQYRTYWMPSGESNLGPIAKFAREQWGPLTLPVILASIPGAAIISRRHLGVFATTLVTFLVALLFAFGYNISEIEPYLVPVYMVLVLWLGVGALLLLHMVPSQVKKTPSPGEDRWLAKPSIAAVLTIAALLLAYLQYPRQDRSHDYMAERFVSNVFSTLPQNSIVITDYWDFYAPTYYLQRVRGERPDLAIIDMSLLRYPWYTTQLRKHAPDLVEKSADIVAPFSVEQRKWVNGETFDAGLLNNLYLGLLTSFVERNPERRAYVLFNAPCNQPQAPTGCEGSQIAPGYARFPSGLSFELVKPGSQASLPSVPDYDLRGITTDRVRLDEFAVVVAQHYRNTYLQLANLYKSRNREAEAQAVMARATEITDALRGLEDAGFPSGGR